ncbi:MAG: exodeoxyribonuclease VII large subunit [Ardenticatenia bacterium]|nr:exodeoxyribonuclease VII large subunit [Ardenticatenia bacterium]
MLTVGELTAYVQALFESDPLLADVRLRGEVSNWKQATSGHCYFTLKDAEAQISCVMWRSAAKRVAVLPQDGDEIVARGNVTIYPRRGVYQLYVTEIEPLGQGILYRRFEALKSALHAEGLFDEARKRPLPPFPRRIGVVTSPKAAALRDILNVLRRRHPLVEVILSPTPVQGSEAPPKIVSALEALWAVGVDVIIVARGGGALEELWAFNDEGVARAIARSPVPVISGVGHEVDFTIADFAADRRAPTPSAAAEVAVPDRRHLLADVREKRARLNRVVEALVAARREQLEREKRLLEYAHPAGAITHARARLDTLRLRLVRSAHHSLRNRHHRLHALQGRLHSLSPKATLRRGYAAVTSSRRGHLVRHPREVSPGDQVRITVAGGAFHATVRHTERTQE